MYENYPNREGPDDVLVNLTDMNQSQILAECVKFGAEQGWDDDYLSGVLESNQLFERVQILILRDRGSRIAIEKLEETKSEALRIAKGTHETARAEGFRQIVEQCKQEIKLKKQAVQDLKTEIEETQGAYEQTTRSTMESFKLP